MTAPTLRRSLVLTITLAAAGLLHAQMTYFEAGSRVDRKALGGFARSDNDPKRIDRSVPPKQVSLIAFPDERVPIGNQNGFRVVLANTTNREVAFDAYDSRLPILKEAQDAAGQWRAVESMPRIWCGNSFHRVFLPRDRSWAFAVPESTGSFQTRLRFALKTSDGVIFSNEFEGAIEPELFRTHE